MDLSKVKVSIFDVNGVLIDSNLANAQAMGQAFTDNPVLQQRIAEQYLDEFGKLAKTNNSIIIPSDLSDIAGMIKAASSVIKDRTEPVEQA